MAVRLALDTNRYTLQHDLVLCARDRHFDHLPQITQA